MVDTILLEEAISKSGKSKTYLANKCGMTIQTFRLKCINKSEFTTREVDNLSAELGIKSLTEMHKIFFAKK